MTARDYIDEVKVGLLRYEISTFFSDPEILSYINRARRDAQRLTIGRYPERYSVILNVTLTEDAGLYPGRYYAVLPDGIMDIVGVYLNYTDINTTAAVSSRARQSSYRELSSILTHSWNAPSIKEPAYLMQRSPITDENNLYLFIGDLTLDINDYATGVSVEIWATVAIGEIEDYDIAGADDTEVIVPTMFEELVILLALKTCIEKTHDQAAIGGVMVEINDYAGLFDLTEYFKMESQTILLPSKEGI